MTMMRLERKTDSNTLWVTKAMVRPCAAQRERRSSLSFERDNAAAGGGFVMNAYQCPAGYSCIMTSKTPDMPGKCHKDVACVQKVTAELGPVDILVNNAGITRDMTFKKMDRLNWDAVMHTNLDSCFNMTKQVCEPMVEREYGCSCGKRAACMVPSTSPTTAA